MDPNMGIDDELGRIKLDEDRLDDVLSEHVWSNRRLAQRIIELEDLAFTRETQNDVLIKQLDEVQSLNTHLKNKSIKARLRSFVNKLM